MCLQGSLPWLCPSGHFCPPRLHKLWTACLANMSDWQDYYEDHSDGFASKHQSADEAFAHSDSDLAENEARSEEEAAAGPVEPSQVEPCPEKDAAEFITLDSIRNRSFARQVVAAESSAWRDVQLLTNIRFNFAAFFLCLQRCYGDLLRGQVHMRTHLGPLLDQFELVLESGLLPESYITQVDALFENIKLLLPRLDMNRRSKAKKRMERIAAQLHLFKDDCFSPVWDLCQNQATELKALRDLCQSQAVDIKNLQARVLELGHQHDRAGPLSLSSSSSNSVDAHSSSLQPSVCRAGLVEYKQNNEELKTKGKSVKHCHVCGLLLPQASFSRSQWRKTDGDRRCASCSGLQPASVASVAWALPRAE